MVTTSTAATKHAAPIPFDFGAPAGSRLRATRRPNILLSPPPCLALALSFFTPSFFPHPLFCLKLRQIPSLSLCHLPHLLPMLFSQISWVSVLSSASWMNIVSLFPFFLLLLALIVLQVGNDTSSIPPAVINYLAALRSRVGSKPLRIRIGGNSMDSSNYVPSQTSPMVQLIDNAPNANDQPVNFSPILWDVLDKVSSDIGGATYLLGLYCYLICPSPS